MRENPEKTKTAILTFGSPDRKQALFENIKLPQHPGNVLDNKKLTSLSEKYFSMPPEKPTYYPAVPMLPSVQAEKEVDPEQKTVAQMMNRTKRHPGADKKVKQPALLKKAKQQVGHPKNSREITANQPS